MQPSFVSGAFIIVSNESNTTTTLDVCCNIDLQQSVASRHLLTDVIDLPSQHQHIHSVHHALFETSQLHPCSCLPPSMMDGTRNIRVRLPFIHTSDERTSFYDIRWEGMDIVSGRREMDWSVRIWNTGVTGPSGIDGCWIGKSSSRCHGICDASVFDHFSVRWWSRGARVALDAKQRKQKVVQIYDLASQIASSHRILLILGIGRHYRRDTHAQCFVSDEPEWSFLPHTIEFSIRRSKDKVE